MVKMVVRNRYQKLATNSSSMTRKLRPETICTRKSSSWKPTTDASEVVLSIEMVSLPVGGTITRMA